MGIKDLKSLIQKHSPNGMSEKSLSSYSGKTIAIDTSIYFYRFMAFGNYLTGFVKQILMLKEYNIRPLYVFDGKPPDEKSGVIKERKERKDKDIAEKMAIETKITNCNDANDLKKLKSQLYNIDKRIIIVTQEHNNMAKQLFQFFGVPYLIANGEAEILCAKLEKHGYVDACLSEDTDLMPNGCKLFLNNFKVISNYVIEYNLEIILEEMKLTHDQFIDMCILCGCDYTCKIEGLATMGAYAMIRKYKNIEGIINFINFQKKHGKVKYTVPENFDYRRAREIFNTELDKLVEINIIKFDMHTLDKTLLSNFIKTNCPDLPAKFLNMMNKTLSPPINKKIPPVTKTIDMYFSPLKQSQEIPETVITQ